MQFKMRMYATDDDYWRIRSFLREVFLRNGRRELSWHVARWDYWRWPGVESWGDGPLEEKVAIWELPDGRIAAVLNSEGPGEAFMQVHPDLRTLELEIHMLQVAEKHLAAAGDHGATHLGVWADSGDELRNNILRQNGYARSSQVECQHRILLLAPVAEQKTTENFTIRSLAGADELPRRSWFSWKAFHPDEDEANYAKLGWQWYLDIQRCPLYRRDLDIVAVAPNGDLASFCTVWYDDATRSAYFEPVATYKPYRRRGLAKAVMREGLRRVRHLGATIAFVGGYSPEANALYATVMGPECDFSEQWVKTF
jgi:mycothiol synthase